MSHWKTQQRDHMGRFGSHNGRNYRKSDIAAAFIAGVNSAGKGALLPSKKLELYLKANKIE